MYTDLPFNSTPSTIMHIDLNSCFASIEQQANPLLRGKPIVVAAYNSPRGCILAASVEAKKLGVKTGLRVEDGKRLCPKLIVLLPDPWKYRCIHLRLRHLLGEYTSKFTPKSIDEFTLDMKGSPVLEKGIINIAVKIKERIKSEIGDWLTVSIGIAPNRFLAKTASNLHKPDGLDEINDHNFMKVYFGLQLTDLCGIKLKNQARLNQAGIFTVFDFYQAAIQTLKAAFSSILGYYWYLRIRGWEIDEVEFPRKSFGNSYALPKPLVLLDELSPILQTLIEKTGIRLRQAGFWAKGIHVNLVYNDRSFWNHQMVLAEPIFSNRDIYKYAMSILKSSPRHPVALLAISCFDLVKQKTEQFDLFNRLNQDREYVLALDTINKTYGDFTIIPARILKTQRMIHDRIAFGGVKELEEFCGII